MMVIELHDRKPIDPYEEMENISNSSGWHQDQNIPTVIRSNEDNRIWAWHEKGCKVSRSLDDGEVFLDQMGNAHHIACNKELNSQKMKRTPIIDQLYRWFNWLLP